MTIQPAIGFVVPAFNAERTIGDTLRSLLSQTLERWVAVVVDDGSRDRSVDVAASFKDPRISIVRQANAGVARARNVGLRAIRSETVAFIDADDVIAPRYAERMLAGLSTESEAVACWHSIVGPDLSDLGWTVPVRLDELTAEALCRFNPLAVGAVVARRRALDRLATQQELGIPTGQLEAPFRTEDGTLADWGHWLRAAKAGLRWSDVVPEPLYLYRMVNGSLSRDVRAMCRDGVRMIGMNASTESRPAHLRAWNIRCLARAVALRDHEATQEYRRDIGSWSEIDRDVLAGSMRWAFQFQDQVGPSETGHFMEEWARAVETALPDFPWPEVIRPALLPPRDRWRRAAGRAIGMMVPGDRLVMYGAGRNGRECAAALADLRVEFDIVDDRWDAEHAAGAASPASLDARCVVIVTPDDHSSLLRSLREMGCDRVVSG